MSKWLQILWHNGFPCTMFIFLFSFIHALVRALSKRAIFLPMQIYEPTIVLHCPGWAMILEIPKVKFQGPSLQDGRIVVNLKTSPSNPRADLPHLPSWDFAFLIWDKDLPSAGSASNIAMAFDEGRQGARQRECAANVSLSLPPLSLSRCLFTPVWSLNVQVQRERSPALQGATPSLSFRACSDRKLFC